MTKKQCEEKIKMIDKEIKILEEKIRIIEMLEKYEQENEGDN